MEKKKKMENPLSDSHREFLDMDTDEEDFERQGSFAKLVFFFFFFLIIFFMSKL